MNAFSSWVRTLTVVTVVCGLLRALVPEGKMKGTFRFLCGVVIIGAALNVLPARGTLFSAADGLFRTDEATGTSLSEAQQTPALWAAQTAFSEKIGEAFTALVLPFEAQVHCEAAENADVSVQVTVTGQGTEAQLTQAQSVLASLLPPDADVIWNTEAVS